MRLTLYHTHLAFEYPFTISKGTKTHQDALIVAIEKNGIIGYGEAPTIKYYNISVEQMMADIVVLKDMLPSLNFNNPNDCWLLLSQKLKKNYFALCALDMAIHDWNAKSLNKKIHEIFGAQWKNIPATDYTLGIDSLDKIQQKIEQHPFPIYKIKLGLGNEEETLKFIKSITSSLLRIDFNEGLTEHRFTELLPCMKNCNVELIEQPLSKYNEIGMRQIFNKSSIDLFADEFCVNEDDVDKCVGKFNGINIKLTKCGGITPALRMIKNARHLGLKVMMGCMNESTIGSAAIAQFLPMIDKVDMDGILLLKEDIANGISFNNQATCTEPHEHGLGIVVDSDKLNKFKIFDIQL